MKTKICIYDVDLQYGKKFCNAAMRIMGDKYIFMYFKDIKTLIEFKNENDIKAIITTQSNIDAVRDIESDFYYVLIENDIKLDTEGRTKYIFKYQKINKILDIINEDIEKLNKRISKSDNKKSKMILLYSPVKISEYENVVKKILRHINKKVNVLLVRTEEYENYKNNIGFSNLIYQYKEDNLTSINIKHEIIKDNLIDVDVIHSVSYPEDYNVINNIDFCNIINCIREIDYEYVIISLDESYVKNQYLFIECDKIIIIKENDNKYFNIFKSYIKSQNTKYLKKITELVIDKNDKNQIRNFVKGLLNE